LTKEFVKHFEIYKAWRHRERTIVSYLRGGTQPKRIKYKPEERANDLIFSTPHRDPKRNASVSSLYIEMLKATNAILDRIGLDGKENSGVHKVTRHSFRRYVYSMLTDAGYHDFADFFLGHSGSTYYRKSDQEKAQLFNKLEPSLTFFDVTALEQKAVVVNDKVDALHEVVVKTQRQNERMMMKFFTLLQEKDPRLAGIKPEEFMRQLEGQI